MLITAVDVKATIETAGFFNELSAGHNWGLTAAPIYGSLKPEPAKFERLEAFSADCGRPGLLLFGHTHGYSRGQSLEHRHAAVNVATAGGAIGRPAGEAAGAGEAAVAGALVRRCWCISSALYACSTRCCSRRDQQSESRMSYTIARGAAK